MSRRQRQKQIDHNNFAHAKEQFLGKPDKSSAGRIDAKVVELCAAINALECFYTCSSCSGRCFLYTGHGIKATNDFERFQVSHDIIDSTYFDCMSNRDASAGANDNNKNSNKNIVWLRMEPFLLHVACRSVAAATALMAAARPSFKNVGITTCSSNLDSSSAKCMVAIWGDEGLDMPLTDPSNNPGKFLFEQSKQWLVDQVNQRLTRNWQKTDRFLQAIRDMPPVELIEIESFMDDLALDEETVSTPKSFDVIGDVALLHTLPAAGGENDAVLVGQAIMKKNKGIKVVALRQTNLEGSERAPQQLQIIAGAQRDPLITTHSEYGVKCVVDLNRTFFSPRMGQERLRLCQQVTPGEHVLIVFAGVCMEGFQIVSRTEATSVTCIELNEHAIMCARRAHRMLERNDKNKASERIEIIHGDVGKIVPSLPRQHYDRIVAPRPKEGAMDGDIGNGNGGIDFLRILLPVLKSNGGECHWYDFAADHEYPTCERTKDLIGRVCEEFDLQARFLHVAHVGSVAVRQLRVCIDFRVLPKPTYDPTK